MLSFHRLAALVVLIFGVGATALSQSLPKSFIPPSPNAANLGLYTNMPVNPYTGVPDITIPIHTFKINGLDLNVNLSYHAGGIRYADEASWVGLGWSLNSGGVIGRTKRGKDDFGPNGFFKVNKTNVPCEDIPDYETDLFFFNFAGYTGKFILDYNGNTSYPAVRKLIKDGLQITNTATGGWKIVDENGITYEFEKKETTTDVFTRPGFSETETYTSSWYLTKISNIFGETIDLYYSNTGNKFYRNIRGNASTSLIGCYPSDLFSSYYMIGNQTGLGYYSTLTGSSVSSTSEVTTDEIVLSTISCHYDYLYFIAGNRTDVRLQNTGAAGKKLDQILLKSRGYSGTPYDAVIKTYNLNYDYFNSQSGQPDHVSKRLQLTNVQETAGSTTVPPFVFSYTTNTLPDKSNQSGFVHIPDGLLNKIDYPTGGSTSYEYEPHIGFKGARIRKISQTDFTGNYNTRYYDYVGGKTLGQSIPIAGSISTTSVEATLAGNPISASVFWQTIVTSENVMMGESSSSYLVGYDQVIEYSGPSGEFGKTVYTYKNEQSAQAYLVPADVSNANGFLLSKEDFAYVNGGYVPVKTISRQPYLQNIFTVQARRKIPGFDCNHTDYVVKSDWVQVSSETEITYDQNGNNPVTRTTAYTYNNPAYVYPTSKRYVDSKNATWDTYYKYTDDRTVEGGVYPLMNQKNIVKQLEAVVTKNNVLVSRTKTNYKDWDLNQKGKIAPETEEHQKVGSNVETRVRYYSYNELGKPTDLGGEDNFRTNYIWGYQKTLPIAEIKMPNIGDLSGFYPETFGIWDGQVQVARLGEIGFLDLDHDQTVKFNGALTPIAGNPMEVGQFRIILRALDTDQEVYNKLYNYPPQTINESVSLPQGQYRVYYVYLSYLDPIDGQSATEPPTLQLGFTLSVTDSRYVERPNCFYTSFEEYGIHPNNGPALTGVNVYPGTYNFQGPGQPGQYKLSYWQRPENGGTWELKQQIFTGSLDYQINVGTPGYVIDEVRVCPVGALMTTYTYDPQKGMTSKNDEKNQVTYYEYDDLGRLKRVLDHNRNILKTFTYSFQEQQ